MSSIQNAKEYIQWINETVKLDAISGNAQKRKVSRGQVYWCYFGINVGCEQSEKRPCLILQNNLGNLSSANTIVAPITHTSSKLDIVIPINNKYDANSKLILDGHVLLGNVITISKSRLGDFITNLTKDEMNLVDIALSKSIDLHWKYEKYKNIIADKETYIDKLKSIISEKDKEIEKLHIFIDNHSRDE